MTVEFLVVKSPCPSVSDGLIDLDNTVLEVDVDEVVV